MERITLKSAIELLQADERPTVAIVERRKGFGLAVSGNVIRSQREDELTFLTYDAAIRYAGRHLAPQLSVPLLISVQLP